MSKNRKKVKGKGENYSIRGKNGIYIPKGVTKNLGEYIEEEEWGAECTGLFRCLDYTFRCQRMDEQVIFIFDKSNRQLLIFHTSLKRRKDKKYLYMIAHENNGPGSQQWMVSDDVPISQIYKSKDELVNIFGLDEKELPERTKFYYDPRELFIPQETIIIKTPKWMVLFSKTTDENSLLYKAKKERKNVSFKRELENAFNRALKNTRDEYYPRQEVPTAFVDANSRRYGNEFSLPLNVNFRNKLYKYVISIRSDFKDYGVYIVTGIWSYDIAYYNARLVLKVNSSWLTVKKPKIKEQTIQLNRQSYAFNELLLTQINLNLLMNYNVPYDLKSCQPFENINQLIRQFEYQNQMTSYQQCPINHLGPQWESPKERQIIIMNEKEKEKAHGYPKLENEILKYFPNCVGIIGSVLTMNENDEKMDENEYEKVYHVSFEGNMKKNSDETEVYNSLEELAEEWKFQIKKGMKIHESVIRSDELTSNHMYFDGSVAIAVKSNHLMHFGEVSF